MDADTILVSLMNNGWFALILLVLSFIKIPKVELNLWGLMGKSFTRDIAKRIDELDKNIEAVQTRLDSYIKDQNEHGATTARQRILKFNDELVGGMYHSKEHFDDILENIDKYEAYCNAHPDYQNNKCVLAISNIKSLYKQKCKESANQALKDDKDSE